MRKNEENHHQNQNHDKKQRRQLIEPRIWIYNVIIAIITLRQQDGRKYPLKQRDPTLCFSDM